MLIATVVVLLTIVALAEDIRFQLRRITGE